MTPHEQEQHARPRPRSNTTSFTFPSWRKPRPNPPPPLPSESTLSQSLTSVDTLVESLSPPNVQSIGHARNLAALLASSTHTIDLNLLYPILVSLCASDSPRQCRAAGFDILAAYWENNAPHPLSTVDRFRFFSLFLDMSIQWAVDIWESRFKALRAFTKGGSDVVGLELQFFNIVKTWIQGAFDPLLSVALDQSERTERERSVDLLAKFLTASVENSEVVARVFEAAGVMSFYANLCEKSINSPSVVNHFDATSARSLSPNDAGSPSQQPTHFHRRHPSSMSISSMPSAVSPSTPTKHPTDIAFSIYLNHLQSQMKAISSPLLYQILPLLFRGLAHYASPLPRLSVVNHPPTSVTSENRITDCLETLFAGPFSATCMSVLKRCCCPPEGLVENPYPSLQISFGGLRNLRNHIRKGLCIRLAREYLSREYSTGYSRTSSAANVELEKDLMERAWPKDDVHGWDPVKLGQILCQAVEAWVRLDFGSEVPILFSLREKILDEAACTLKDIFQELDAREENSALNEEEAVVVGETLYHLAAYIPPLQSSNGTTFTIPLNRPGDAPSAFLRSLCSLLARDHSTYLSPPLSSSLLLVAGNLTDMDSSKLPVIMLQQHDLSPTSSNWLDNWENILSNPHLLSHSRLLTRQAVMDSLHSVYDLVKDMPVYRTPLGSLVYYFCRRQLESKGGEALDHDLAWQILGDEIVSRKTEGAEEIKPSYQEVLDLMASAGMQGENEEAELQEAMSVLSPEVLSPSPSTTVHTTTHSTPISPILSRMHSDFQSATKDKESTLPSVMSLLGSLASAGTSQFPSAQRAFTIEPQETQSPAPTKFVQPRSVSVVVALIAAFSQIAFTPIALDEAPARLSVRLYQVILDVFASGRSTKARLVAAQFLMWLRADRDHHIYYDLPHDTDGQISALASLINKIGSNSSPEESNDGADIPAAPSNSNVRQDREERGASQAAGRTTANSRSQSRATQRTPRTPRTPNKVAMPLSDTALWQFPESLMFSIKNPGRSSETLVSYDALGSPSHALPINLLLDAISVLVERERSWDLVSYVLCILPTQLANKHLFCGQKSREAVARLINVLCSSIMNGNLASGVDYWPPGIKARDAQCLGYHSLSVLISYWRCLTDAKSRQILVEVFENGLNEQPATVECCIHSLAIAAFELQPSVTRSLSRIMERLSQIMSSPDMTVHILGFLSIVGSLPELHANFNEGNFKTVFGLALQYLQHHNRVGSSSTMSWALSQHVRVLSYRVLYTWFLAVKLPDRPRHVRYITRQLLLANEGKDEIDQPTEVCFDWLARYSYASADPRPATSILGEIMAEPKSENVLEKTWIQGNSTITIRGLSKPGWAEIITRSPSGCTKFICRLENVPMVGPGDVDPDLTSISAVMLMGQNVSRPDPETSGEDEDRRGDDFVQKDISAVAEQGERLPVPDPITGYVWGGTAPSQRRKAVAVDPSFFALQLSNLPGLNHSIQAIPVKSSHNSQLQSFISILDRIPVIDTHKVGILYVAPGQVDEIEILRNSRGSPAYTRFLEGIGRLIDLRGQVDVYAGGLDPDEDGQYAYAWWDDIGQILYHTATMMPTSDADEFSINKKRHIGNDYVRIVWNDSGLPYRFETLSTQFQFVNIVIEPHSRGAIAAFSNNIHQNEFFKVIVQKASDMPEFAPVGAFKLISAESLPLLVRQLSLLADWFASVFERTERDTEKVEMMTNWHARLQAIQRFRSQVPAPAIGEPSAGILTEEDARDFTLIVQ